MRLLRPRAAAVPLLAVLLLTACAGAVEDTPHVIENEPAALETVAGSEIPRVVLTEQAAQRLSVTTTAVAAAPEGLVVPSTAVFVDTHGVWWVYTVAEPLVFVRNEIGMVRQDGGMSYLSSGPAVGTEVVTVGVAELAGVENEVGH